MPEFEIRTTGNTEDDMSMIKKTLHWLLNNLDDMNVKRIRTEYCQITSADGETAIQGPLIIMKDGSGNIRKKEGLDKALNKFVWEIFNAIGERTIYMNDSGSAVFADTIETSKDAVVGNNLTLGNPTALTAKYIYFYNSGSDLTRVGIDSSGNFAITTFKNITLDTAQTLSLTPTNLDVLASQIDIAASGADLSLSATSGGNIILSDNAYLVNDSTDGNYISKNSETGNSLAYNSSTKVLQLKNVQGTVLSSVTLV